MKSRNAKVTLARALSKLGVTSRSQAGKLIESGSVQVNRKTIVDPSLWIDLRLDRIVVDGRPAKKPTFMYLAMNKPVGIITTRSDEHRRKTVYDLLPAEMRTLSPIGRLDKDSSGLLLFTNDTQLAERITNPATHLLKVYHVKLSKPLEEQDVEMLESPMTLDNGIRLQPAHVRLHQSDTTKCRMEINEGKNRQIRRSFEFLGYEVESLMRVSIGPIILGSLGPGKVRGLTGRELAALRNAASMMVR